MHVAPLRMVNGHEPGTGRSDAARNQAQGGGWRSLLHVQDLDLALPALNIHAGIVVVPPDDENNRGLAYLEIFDANLL